MLQELLPQVECGPPRNRIEDECRFAAGVLLPSTDLDHSQAKELVPQPRLGLDTPDAFSWDRAIRAHEQAGSPLNMGLGDAVTRRDPAHHVTRGTDSAEHEDQRQRPSV